MNDLEALSTAVHKRDKQKNSVISAMQKRVNQASIKIDEHHSVRINVYCKESWDEVFLGIQRALPNETSNLLDKDLLLFLAKIVQQVEVVTAKELSTVACVKTGTDIPASIIKSELSTILPCMIIQY